MNILTKKVMHSAFAFACSLALFSCADFLNIEPKTFVSEDNFWNEKADIDQMVAGCYVKMQEGAFIERCLMWGETRSDNISLGKDVAEQTNIYRTLRETLFSTNAYTDWNSFYAVINQCNTIIYRAPEVSQKDPVYTESDVRATVAEMKALRSLCYFYLVRAFKDVPYYTYAIEQEDQVHDIAPSDGDSIVRELIVDLEGCVSDALKAYPEDNSVDANSTKNRITQNAIYALLADLCLWNGDYAKTVNYAQRVIDSKYQEYIDDYSLGTSLSGGNVALFRNTADIYNEKAFPLYPCFSGNSFGNDFNQTFCSYQNGFESIFELAFNPDGGSTQRANGVVASLYGNLRDERDSNLGEGYLSVSEDLVGDLSSGTSGTYFNNKDARYFASIYNPGETEGQFNIGYVRKYVADNVSIQTNTQGTLKYKATTMVPVYDSRNFIFYRLTDVMLMQAEALTELGSVDADGNLDENLKRAFYIVWAVNRRSIMVNSTSTTDVNELKLSNYTSQEMMRELVLNERRVELMFEGKRWFDLLRQCHRMGTTDYIRARVSAKGSSGAATSLFANYESLYWPYNKTEINNNGLLNQKPYYGSGGDDDSFSSTK